MVRLKDQMPHAAFLQRVRECKGEVLFRTGEGDTLNLKSMLSQLLFTASFLKPEIVRNAVIICSEENDFRILADFLTEIEDIDG